MDFRLLHSIPLKIIKRARRGSNSRSRTFKASLRQTLVTIVTAPRKPIERQIATQQHHHQSQWQWHRWRLHGNNSNPPGRLVPQTSDATRTRPGRRCSSCRDKTKELQRLAIFVLGTVSSCRSRRSDFGVRVTQHWPPHQRRTRSATGSLCTGTHRQRRR